MTTTFATTRETINSAELHAAVGQILSGYFQRPRRVTGLEQRPSEYGSSYHLEELEVRLEDGTVLSLMLKALGERALSEKARRAKPSFLRDSLREIETYRRVLGPSGIGPICYGVLTDAARGRHWLFLEKVLGVELYQSDSSATWQEAARWLGSMHAGLADAAEDLRRELPLLNYDQEFFRLWIERARTFFCAGESEQSRGVKSQVEWLAGMYERVLDYLIELPKTFVHGEFYASNVLVSGTGGGARVCPVDWEMAGVGSGLLDLAALTAGNWTEAEKSAMARAYYDALPTGGGWFQTFEDLLLALEYCRLHVCMQWLGWFGRRRPAPQHARDWLGEAVELAERLVR